MWGILLFMAMNPFQEQGLAGRSDTQIVRVPFDASQWDLVWADEFDRGPEPNEKDWGYEYGKIRNNEAQFYTRNRRENARIENGKLILEARKDGFEGHAISSASLTTKGKRTFLYGRLEIRAKVPTGRGTWPAFWTLGENIDQLGWPKCGEIDILENVGFDPKRVHANVHTDAYNHMKRNGRGNNLLAEAPWERFHVYAVEWFPDRLEFFFDDQRYFVYRKESKDPAVWPFAQPHFVILNLAIGGAWGGQQGIDESKFPHRYEIEYVRHYRKR